MKTIMGLLTGILTIAMISCEEDTPPNTAVKANFSATGYDKPVPCQVSFFNTASNAASFFWSFGDGTTSTEANPTHTYTSIGTYFLKLKVTGHGGEADSVCKILYWGDASNPTKSSFSYFQDRCTGTPASFSFFSLNPLSQSWAWDFDNGVSALVRNPLIQYAATGSYTVKFSSIINGVRDTVVLGLNIN